MVILKEFFEKVNFEKCSRRQKNEKFPSMQKVNSSPVSSSENLKPLQFGHILSDSEGFPDRVF